MRRIVLFLFIIFASSMVVCPVLWMVRSYGVGGVIHVPNDYLTIQEAVDAANPCDTILVSTGTYHERITIDKALELLGENPETTIINGNQSGDCIQITADDVVISGFMIKNGTTGIHLYNCENTTLYNNILVSNGFTVRLYNSNSNRISNNLMQDNYIRGLDLYNSHRNILKHNVILNEIMVSIDQGLEGIALISSNDNIVEYNEMSNFFVAGITLEGSKNRVSYNEITDLFFGSCIRLDSSSENLVKENTLQGAYSGLMIYGQSETIVGNTVKGNYYGVYAGSNNSMFYHNNFIGNTHHITKSKESVWNVWDNGAEGNYWIIIPA